MLRSHKEMHQKSMWMALIVMLRKKSSAFWTKSLKMCVKNPEIFVTINHFPVT